ncbi:hypothetical protein CEXT_351651 [Caerostris extrusa]|uniref:Uncharacterized protein n=1 Tax=Caerostris extrusa TaxID=172846 RepID=A0AAV4V8A7_CAEEX|nr:hypothetical protein CEXT_351651 [Caerostris extrusa]
MAFWKGASKICLGCEKIFTDFINIGKGVIVRKSFGVTEKRIKGVGEKVFFLFRPSRSVVENIFFLSLDLGLYMEGLGMGTCLCVSVCALQKMSKHVLLFCVSSPFYLSHPSSSVCSPHPEDSRPRDWWLNWSDVSGVSGWASHGRR